MDFLFGSSVKPIGYIVGFTLCALGAWAYFRWRSLPRTDVAIKIPILGSLDLSGGLLASLALFGLGVFFIGCVGLIGLPGVLVSVNPCPNTAYGGVMANQVAYLQVGNQSKLNEIRITDVFSTGVALQQIAPTPTPTPCPPTPTLTPDTLSRVRETPTFTPTFTRTVQIRTPDASATPTFTRTITPTLTLTPTPTRRPLPSSFVLATTLTATKCGSPSARISYNVSIQGDRITMSQVNGRNQYAGIIDLATGKFKMDGTVNIGAGLSEKFEGGFVFSEPIVLSEESTYSILGQPCVEVWQVRGQAQ